MPYAGSVPDLSEKGYICINPCSFALKVSDFVPKIAGMQITPIFGNDFFAQNYHANPKTNFCPNS